MRWLVAFVCWLLSTTAVGFADPTPPIRMAYVEGDVAGTSIIWSEDGKRVIGIIEYRQRREQDRLHVARVARFKDGSSDEDEAEVRVGDRLESIRGRIVIRDTRGRPSVDLAIDVAGKRVRGFYLEEGERTSVDEDADIGPGTYWGALVNLVLKNFAANARDGSLVFQTVAPTPKPRVLDMELARAGTATLTRAGAAVEATRYSLLPTIHFLIDPILRRFVPETDFFLADGKPPMLVRFAGPRNHAGQRIRLD